MVVLKKFNDKYAELIAEQSFRSPFSNSGNFAVAAKQTIRFVLRFDRIKEFISESEINAAIDKAIKMTTNLFDEAASSGKTVKLTNIRSKETFNGTVEKNGESYKVINKDDMFSSGLRAGIALAPDAAKMLFDIMNNARKGVRQKEANIAKQVADREKQEKEANEALMQKPEFAAFKDELRKAGLSSVLGSGKSIGDNVPEGFYDFFAKQTDDVKKAFIQYVKNFSTYDPNMEYAESPQWGRERDWYEQRNATKAAFIKKLSTL